MKLTPIEKRRYDSARAQREKARAEAEAERKAQDEQERADNAEARKRYLARLTEEQESLKERLLMETSYVF